MQRFAEPIDKFVMADWQGAEIYEGETYLEMHNGDVVINEIVNIVDGRTNMRYLKPQNEGKS